MTAAEIEALALVVEHGIDLIVQIAAAIASAKAGVIKPEDALAHIGTLHQLLIDQRAAADKALHDRFETVTPIPTGL